jgi:DNA-binding Xre family transcriptional regulator
MKIDIKRTIKENGLTLTQVAEILGITREGLYYHQQRGNNIEVSTLEKIANILGCSVQDFFYNENEETGINIKCPHCGKKITIGKGE